MYHKAKTIYDRSYYDTIDEMPKKAKVFFPDEEEPREMTASEIMELDDQGWYTIMHSVNYGCCDHWTSQKPSKWVLERFLCIINYMRNNQVIGYNRKEWSITLTRNGNYWKSEVWNS